MEALQPLINLLVLLGTLSIAAERLTNVLKLQHVDPRHAWPLRLRNAHPDPRAPQRAWERDVGHQALLVSLGLAVLLKADFFEIVGSLQAPWDTLGWIRLSGSETIISPALDSIPRFLYAVGGSAVTGLSIPLETRVCICPASATGRSGVMLTVAPPT